VGIRSGAGVLAALVAGTALGAISRGLMALVSLAAEGSSSFSWSGTAFVVLLYVLMMVPGGAVAGLTTHRLRWLLPAAGALFLCVPAIGVAGEEVGGRASFVAAQWLGVGLAGGAVFATIGVLPLVTVRLADRWLGRRRGGPVPAPSGSEVSSPAAAAG
jgi:hypothetical protein